MANEPCPREPETIRMAWSDDGPRVNLDARGEASPGTWVDADLAAHLADCESCAAIAGLARALREDRDAACAAAHPPSSGAVWWRAQRRAREEAARQAARPIAIVHGIALGCAGAAVFAILGLGLGGFWAYLSAWLDALSWPALPAASAFDAVSGVPIGVLFVLAATLLLAPVAIYLALSSKADL